MDLVARIRGAGAVPATVTSSAHQVATASSTGVRILRPPATLNSSDATRARRTGTIAVSQSR